MPKDEDVLNPCGHRNSERIEALKKFPSSVCPACLLERIEELEDALVQWKNKAIGYSCDLDNLKCGRIKELEKALSNEESISAKAYTACGNYQERIKELEKKIEGAKDIINSQSFWCELADKECVGMKSIVHLVEQALER